MKENNLSSVNIQFIFQFTFNQDVFKLKTVTFLSKQFTATVICSINSLNHFHKKHMFILKSTWAENDFVSFHRVWDFAVVVRSQSFWI